MGSEQPRVGLALSGGAAWGLAHLGVLQALARAGISVEALAGTSVGSLVGALFAARPAVEDLLQVARSTSWRELVNLNASRLGLLGNEAFEGYLKKHLGERTFSRLELPLAVVACDLSSGDEVVFRQGAVAPAVRASCALPGLFNPVEVKGRLLVDGGLVRNLPVEPARELGCEVVVAVDLLGGSPFAWEAPRNAPQVLLQSALIMQRCNIEPEAARADVVVQPRLERLSLWDLEHPEPYLEAGREAMESQLPRLRELLNSI